MTAFFERVHAGLPLDGVEIIDVHAHMGPYYNMHIPAREPGRIVGIMDLCGIAKAIISPSLSWDTDLVFANNLMREAVAALPGRLHGACAVNGNYPELSADELERCFEDSSAVIIKIHPAVSKCRLDDKRMSGIYEFASRRNLCLLVHTWLDNDAFGNMDLFAGVAKDHPDIAWIMGHSGGPYGSRHAVELAHDVPNIYLDTTVSMCPARQVEFFVKEVGPERVLFGTDNPFLDPRPQVGRVALASISRGDKINIFGANARRLINLA